MFAKLFPILGITFIDILGFSILIPILPYYVQHFGASYVAVGALFSTFAFCQFLAGPIWGHVSDRIGRKRVLVVSQIGATIGWTLLAFAPTLAWVFVARIIEGISGGNISVTQAYVADRVAPNERARAFAFVGAAFSAGLVLGPVMGGTLLAHFGYRTPFLLAAALQVVTLLLTIYRLPEQVAAEGEPEPNATPGDIVRFLGDKRISPVLLQKLAFSLGLYAWFASFALALHRLVGFGPVQTSYAFGVFGVFSIVFQLGVVGRVVDRLGTRPTSNLGFCVLALFFGSVPFARTPPALFATMILFSLGLALTNATLAALLTDASPERVRGAVLGAGSSLESVAGVLTPALATALLGVFSVEGPALLALGFVAIALGLGIMAQRRRAPAVRASDAA